MRMSMSQFIAYFYKFFDFFSSHVIVKFGCQKQTGPCRITQFFTTLQKSTSGKLRKVFFLWLKTVILCNMKAKKALFAYNYFWVNRRNHASIKKVSDYPFDSKWFCLWFWFHVSLSFIEDRKSIHYQAKKEQRRCVNHFVDQSNYLVREGW